MTIDGEEGTVIGRKRMNRRDDEVYVKDFIDMVSPSIIQFEIDHYVCGNTYRCVWALREYPTSTEEQAILRNLGEKDGVTLRIYTRQVSPAEERKIISNAANKNRMRQGSTENLQDTITAGNNLQDVADIVSQMHRNKEPLLHTAVYIELTAADPEQLKLLQTEVLTELVRSKLNVDRLLIRQKQGFLSVMPSGWNVFRNSMNGCSRPAVLQTCTHSIIPGRRIRMDSTWAGISLGVTSSWTLTGVRRIRPMPTSSFWETAVRENRIC